MSHIKKTEMPKSWPVPRKGKRKRFVAVPSHSFSKGISLLFLLRDVLKIAGTRKEARYMTLNGMVKVNGKIRKDENFPVQVFDVLSLTPVDKLEVLYYRLEIVNKKFVLKEISDKEAGKKIVKISGKKILRNRIRGVGGRGVGVSGGKNKDVLVQMNLEDGQNVLSKEKFSVGDSVVLRTTVVSGELPVVSVEKILPLKEGAKVEIVLGKHAGEKGDLIGFEDLVRGRNYVIKFEDGHEVSLPFKCVLVIG